MMPIVRLAQRSQYTIIAKETLADTAISWEAKGLLAYLLEKPDCWSVSPSHLAKVGKAGRDKVYRIMRELEQAGYCRKTPIKDPETKQFLRWDYTIYERPITGIQASEIGPLTENPEMGKKPLTENPEMGKKPLTENPEMAFPEKEANQATGHEIRPLTENPEVAMPEPLTEKPDLAFTTLVSTKVSKKEKKVLSHPSCPHEEIRDLYNTICTALPKAKLPSDARKRALTARWRANPKHQSLEFWQWYFELVKNTPFLNGSNNRGWLANFDWIIKSENFVKVIEEQFGVVA